MSAGDNHVLDTIEIENYIEMTQEAEERPFHRMASVQNFLRMWQGSQNLCASQKESHTQSKQMTPIGYISDMEEIVNASWATFLHDGVAAFDISERSPLPQAFLQRILIEYDLKYYMATEPEELAVILRQAMQI